MLHQGLLISRLLPQRQQNCSSHGGHHAAHLAGADADVAGRHVGVLPDVLGELRHERLAEAHHLRAAAQHQSATVHQRLPQPRTRHTPGDELPSYCCLPDSAPDSPVLLVGIAHRPQFRHEAVSHIHPEGEDPRSDSFLSAAAATLRTSLSDLPLGLKSQPPLPPPIGSVVRLFFRICTA